MEEIMKKIKALLELFSKREIAYNSITEDIANLIGPTVMEALYDYFGAPTDAVSWMEMQLMDRHLVVIASVLYKADDVVPEQIAELAATIPTPVIDPSGREAELMGIARILTVAIPITHVFRSKEDILDFLKNSKRGTLVRDPVTKEAEVALIDEGKPVDTPVETSQEQFDTKNLTKEQLAQILYWQQQQPKRIKH